MIVDIIGLLIAERDRIQAAIDALQGERTRSASRVGRAPAKRERATSAVTKKRMADAAKKRWAAIKAGKAANPVARGKRAARGKG